MGKRGKSGSHGKRSSKSKSKGKGKGKGGVKKGNLKADPGAKGGNKGSAKPKGGGPKGAGKGGKGGKGGKDASKKGGGDAADAKGKGKGKARAPPGAPKMTRKERKKASVARAKGFLPKTEETPKPSVPPLGQVKTKKGKKRLRPGQTKRAGGAENAAPKKDAAPKKKRVRVRNRSGKPEDKVSEPEAPKCKKGHVMGHRSDNPATYKNQACCDVCGKENLPKLCSRGKLSHFFHCSFCRFDICPNCAQSYLSGKAKKSKDEKESKFDKKKDVRKEKQAPEPDFIPRIRRELWIPTEAEAVNRAPIKAAVLSDWVEGKPV